MNTTEVIDAVKGIRRVDLKSVGAVAIGNRLCKEAGHNIVVNGSVVPQVAKAFKQAGFPLQTLRHSADGTCAAWVTVMGERVYVYRGDYMDQLGNEYISRRVLEVTGLLAGLVRWAANKLKK